MKTEIPGNRRTTDSLAVSPLRSSGLGVGMTRAVILSESTDFLQLSWDGILQGWLANHGRALEHSSDLPSYLFIPALLGMLGPVKVLGPTATLLKHSSWVSWHTKTRRILAHETTGTLEVHERTPVGISMLRKQ